MSSPDTKEDVTGRKDPSGGEVVHEQSGPDLSSIAGEVGTLLGEKDWLMNLTAKPIGPAQYAVLSARNGNVSVHQVDLRNTSCSCEHKLHNISRQAEACIHIAYAAYADVDSDGLDHGLLSYTAYAANRVAEEADRLTRAATGHEADNYADYPQASGGPAGHSPEPDTPDVQVVAQRLADAFEAAGVTHEMEWTDDTTKEGKDRIWFAFDGKVPSGLFSAYIQEPDAVWYQPDDSPDSDKPNSIMVENVDGYIEDVLE